MSTIRIPARTFALLAILLVVGAGYVRMTMQKPVESLQTILHNAGPSGVPIPFVRTGEMTVPIGASIMEVGELQTGAIKIYMVELSENSAADMTQALSDDAIYLIRTSEEAMDAPFDIAFSATSGHEPDYFLYQYSDSGATQEIANKMDPSFVVRFPGAFAASEQAWINEADHGNALSTFQSQRGITFGPTSISGTGSMHFEPEAMYAIVVNEPGGATINLHGSAVCGDGWKMESEACDDGNATAGDGCSATCTAENQYVCTGNPSVCTLQTACGDGVIDAGEQCDDGAENGTEPSECTATCHFKVPIPFGN